MGYGEVVRKEKLVDWRFRCRSRMDRVQRSKSGAFAVLYGQASSSTINSTVLLQDRQRRIPHALPSAPHLNDITSGSSPTEPRKETTYDGCRGMFSAEMCAITTQFQVRLPWFLRNKFLQLVNRQHSEHTSERSGLLTQRLHFAVRARTFCRVASVNTLHRSPDECYYRGETGISHILS
jgi:hypothetical protein